jgi:tetratricopeptide (TPR) repeat protein
MHLAYASRIQEGAMRQSRTSGDPGAPIVFNFTEGDLRALYALADVAIIGHTWADNLEGAHNMAEPVALGTPVLIGPYIEENEQLAAFVLRHGAGIQLPGLDSLPERLVQLLQSGELQERKAKAQEAARAILEELIKPGAEPFIKLITADVPLAAVPKSGGPGQGTGTAISEKADGATDRYMQGAEDKWMKLDPGFRSPLSRGRTLSNSGLPPNGPKKTEGPSRRLSAENSPATLTTEADVLRESGHLNEALTQIDKALVIDPKHVRAYIVRALIFIAMRRADQALIDTKQALEIDPNSLQARIVLAQALLILGHPREALTMADVAVKRAPKDRWNRTIRTWALLEFVELVRSRMLKVLQRLETYAGAKKLQSLVEKERVGKRITTAEIIGFARGNRPALPRLELEALLKASEPLLVQLQGMPERLPTERLQPSRDRFSVIRQVSPLFTARQIAKKAGVRYLALLEAVRNTQIVPDWFDHGRYYLGEDLIEEIRSLVPLPRMDPQLYASLREVSETLGIDFKTAKKRLENRNVPVVEIKRGERIYRYVLRTLIPELRETLPTPEPPAKKEKSKGFGLVVVALGASMALVGLVMTPWTFGGAVTVALMLGLGGAGLVIRHLDRRQDSVHRSTIWYFPKLRSAA